MSEAIYIALIVSFGALVMAGAILHSAKNTNDRIHKVDLCVVTTEKSREYCAAYVRLNDDR